MEQQLEPQFPRQHVWVERDGDDGEEEAGVSLVARQSKHPNNGRVGTSLTSTIITGDEPELEPEHASFPTKTTSSEHSEEEEEEEEKGEEAVNSRGNKKVGHVDEEGEAVKVEGDASRNSVYFDQLQGTESINGVSELQPEIPKGLSMEINHQKVENAPAEQLHEETDTSFEHCENASEVDANVDLIEEHLLEYDVERVVKKQNTHDLYCPNCSACITRTVILRRRKPKIPITRPKSKRPRQLDPIPAPVVSGGSGGSPEIDSNIAPTTPAPGVQDATPVQGQEALHCSSCFSLFIPIGNGCFKIFQIFRRGKQNDNTGSPQGISQEENRQSPPETSQMENTQSSQEINPNESTESPPEVSQKGKTESPQGISKIENKESPQKVNGEGTKSPSKIGQDEATDGLQKIPSQNGDAQSPQSLNEKEQVLSSINHNESKQSPQKIPAPRTTWIFSVFGFHKGKETKAGHVSSAQDAAAPNISGTNGEHVDGAVIKLEEPGMSNIFPSTNGSLLNNVKAKSREWKLDAGMPKKKEGDSEIKDLEKGLLEPSLPPSTDVEPTSRIGTQNEGRAVHAGEAHEWEILKSIVYGGLIESITSVGIVSSAAGAGADTLNILALGLANLFGGLLVIIHNLRELKNEQPRGASSEINVEEDRYQAVLGRRQNFVLHFTVAILSYIIFGLVPPVVYGFSFRKSDDKDFKLAAVAGASLVCLILLALGKAHVKTPNRTYFRTVSYYVGLWITASGISYVIGVLIRRLLEQLGLFESSSVVSSGMPFLGTIPSEVGRASY